MKKAILVGVLSSVLAILIFLNSSLPNLNRPLANDPDLFFSYFIQDNNLEKITHFQFTELFNTRMLYPHQNTLAFSGTMFTSTLLALPFYLFGNFFVAVNLAILLTCFLTFISMYFLSYQLTKNIPGSILAATVYTYNPWIVSFFPGNPDVLALFWIPLIFLVSEKLLEKITWPKMLLLTLLFICQLFSFFYFIMFLAIIWPIYLLFRLKMAKISLKTLLHPSLLVCTILFFGISIWYSQPYLKVKKDYHFTRSIEYNIFHSAKPTDFLSAGPQNKLYGGTASNTSSEHNLFLGTTVYLLLLIAGFAFIKSKNNPKDKPIILAFFFVFLLSSILAMGPYLILGTLKLPLPYLLIYKFLPFADAMRVPARFIVMTFLGASILSAYALSFLSKFKQKNISIFLIILLAVIEYQFTSPQAFSIDKKEQQFYETLSKQNDIKTILELPMANGLVDNPIFWRDYQEDGIYLLYSLYHRKNLINGYTSLVPPDTVSLSQQLAVNFPTPNKLKALKTSGVDLIIIHKNFYRDPLISQRIISSMDNLVKKIYDSENIIAYILK